MGKYFKVRSQELFELAVSEFGGVITDAYFAVESEVFEHIFHRDMTKCRYCFEQCLTHEQNRGLSFTGIDVILTFDSTEVFFSSSDFGHICRAKNFDIQEQY